MARARRSRGLGGLACLGMVAALTLSGCGGSTPDDAVKRAEAKVTQKQAALDKAKAAFEKASAAACSSAGTYVTAIDRYGDVLNATATTVGDVRVAGGDLSAPKQDALTSAEAAVTAQQGVADAKNELADAEAALERARSAATPSTPSSPPPSPQSSATAKPLAPAATVDRVKAAEADFASTQEGIADKTPLAQASQEFNAAAVALEMSWLRLFADAGCLSGEQQQQAEAAVHDYTVAAQTSLAAAGYYDGKVDGVYGPSTVEAVKALQKSHGLPTTGWVDKATEAALQADLQKLGGAAAQDAIASTAAVQQTLKLAGYWDGPVDGTWSPELTDAVKEFQTALGVKATGEVDAATIAAFEKAIAQGQKGRTSTPSPSPSPSASLSPIAPSSSGSPTT